MSKYQEKKEKLRNQAIEWQNNIANGKFENYSYYKLFLAQEYFYRKGKQYGLLKEFHENGIC